MRQLMIACKEKDVPSGKWATQVNHGGIAFLTSMLPQWNSAAMDILERRLFFSG